MPTEPPSATHNSGPPPLGQPPASAAHLQSHLAYPAHPQSHPLQRPINPAHSPYGISNPRNIPQMPAQPPQPAPAPQQQQQRPIPATFYPVGNYPNNMTSYPQVPGQPFPMGDFMYPQQAAAFMPPSMHHAHNPAAAPQPQPPQPPQPANQRPAAQFPTAPVPTPVPQRQHAASRVAFPPQRKKIMRIVDPDTNEEVKVNKVEAKPSSPGSAPSTSSVKSASPSTSVKIPPRKSRPLAVVDDPNDPPAKSPSSSEVGAAVDAADAPAAPDAPDAVDENGAGDARAVAAAPDEGHNRASANVADQPVAVHANSRTTNEDTSTGATVSPSNPNTSTQPRAAADTATPSTADVADVKRDGPRIEPISSSENETDSRHPAPAEPSKLLEASDISSSTVADAAPDAVDTTTTNQTPPGVMSDAATAEHPVESVTPVPPLNDSAPLPKPTQLSTTSTHAEVPPSLRNGKGAAHETNPSPEKNVDSSADMTSRASPAPSRSESALSLSKPEDDPQDSADIAAEGEMIDEFPRYPDGERRVYSSTILFEMRKLVGLKRASQFNNELGNLLKSAQKSQDMRSGRHSRSNTGQLDRNRSFLGQGASGNFQVPHSGAPPPGGRGPGYGPSDQIDLLKARSQAVPPNMKHQYNRDGDPRGTRSMGPLRGGRMDHGMRSHGSLDQFRSDISLPKLKRTENGWKRDRDSDDAVTAKVKQVRSLLNKLTLEKFEKIFGQIVDIDISNFETLTGVVKEIFEKTLFEPKFSHMYAELCRRLDTNVQPILDKKEPSGKLNFKRILLSNCKDEFTRFANSSGEKNAEGNDSADAPKEESENKEPEKEEKAGNDKEKDKDTDKNDAKEKEKKEAREKKLAETEASNAKKRMLGNVRFISELFLKDLLREQIIHRNCIHKLLTLGIEKKEEDVLEALCKLISTTGAKLSENKDATPHIDNYFRHLEHFSRDMTLPARIRFMVQDLIEQRHNNWKVRREEAKAKTISEIHKDIEKEERAKQEAAAALKDRRGRGQGGMHHRDRSGGNHPTRVHMTMAMNRQPASNVSRTTASLEKYSSRASVGSNISGLAGIRLGPGGGKGAPGSGGLTLRPNGGGSRFNILGGAGQQSDNRDPNAAASSGDPRRLKVGKAPTAQRRTVSKPEPETPQEKVLDPKELRNQVQRKLKYYWLEKDLSDTLELIDKGFSEANHLAFVREALKQSFEAKIAESESSEDVFKGLVGTVINPKYFVSAFSEMVALAPDMEMDNPRVLEFLGRYIGCCAATKKLGGMTAGADLGLGFLKKPISEYTDKKKAAKLMVQVFSSTFKHMQSLLPEEEERKQTVLKAFEATEIDLALLMKSWNFMRGMNVLLDDMLKPAGVSFLVPTLETEIELDSVIAGGPTLESVSGALNKFGAAPTGNDAIALMRVVTRVSLEWFLQTCPDENVFKDNVAKAIVQYYSGSIPEDVQMAVVLGVQDLFAKNDKIPATYANRKSVVAALHVLYDGDVIEEDALMAWKDDTGMSTKVAGKEKMLMDSIQFFKWLEEADEEE